MDKIYKILPRYAFLPIFLCLIINIITYFGTRIFTQGMYHYDFSCRIDDSIPFTTWMIWIYILAYVAWIVGFVVIARESRAVCYEVLTGEQIAKLICLVIFIVVPTTLVRPQITGNSISDFATNMIYLMDSPDNLMPSVHCLESWLCFRGALRCKKVGKGYKSIMFIAAILVFASTLMVKQHVVIDVLTAILVVEAGLILAKKVHVYEWIQSKTENNRQRSQKKVGNERK